jgi:hypothetical protein
MKLEKPTEENVKFILSQKESGYIIRLALYEDDSEFGDFKVLLGLLQFDHTVRITQLRSSIADSAEFIPVYGDIEENVNLIRKNYQQNENSSKMIYDDFPTIFGSSLDSKKKYNMIFDKMYELSIITA